MSLPIAAGRDSAAALSTPKAAAPLWAGARSLPLLGIIGVLFVTIYATTFAFMIGRWATDPAATHGWLVLPIVAWIVWEKREKLRVLPLGSNVGGLWVMAFALLMHLSEKAVDLNGPSPLSIPIFVAGAVWYFGGTAWLRELCFPIAYLCFMIPIPGGLTQVVTFPLQLLATNGSRAIVGHLGIPIAGSGVHMEFWMPGRPHIAENFIAMEIAVPCSGIHSLMAIKALHAITAYKTRLRLGWKWVLFMCAIPVALAANLCRIVSIILISGYINKEFGLNMWHENIAPYLVFGFAIVILISLGRFMEWATGATRSEKTGVASPAAQPAVVENPRELTTAPNYRVLMVMMGIALAFSTFFTMRPQDDDLPVANVSGIPGDLGEWRCVAERPLDNSLMSEMKADSYVDRIYENVRTRQNVEAMLVYRRYGRREFAHRPDQCYPAAGYNITSKDHTTLPYGGRDVDAIHLTADGRNVQYQDQKTGAIKTGVPPETLTYFFASGSRTESDFMKQQLLMSIERLIPNKNGWTFIRLSSQRVTTDDEALQAQQEFMRTYGGPIEKQITTDKAAEPAVARSAAISSPTDAFETFK